MRNDGSPPFQVLSPIHRAFRQLTLHLEDTAKERNIPYSPDEIHVISFVGAYGPVSVGEVRRVVGHKPSTMTSILNRLEKQGLLTRELDPDDRRSILVAATEDGMNLTGELMPIARGVELQIFEQITPEDMAGFQRVLQAIEAVTKQTVRTSKTPAKDDNQ